MESKFGLPAAPEVEQLPASVELIKLIRKLRWIGLEDEARELQSVLNRFPPEQRAVLPGTPRDCD